MKNFSKGIRKIVQEGTGTYVEWKDLQEIFSQVAEHETSRNFSKNGFKSQEHHRSHVSNLSVQPDPLQPAQNILSGTISQKESNLQTTPADSRKYSRFIGIQYDD